MLNSFWIFLKSQTRAWIMCMLLNVVNLTNTVLTQSQTEKEEQAEHKYVEQFGSCHAFFCHFI